MKPHDLEMTLDLPPVLRSVLRSCLLRVELAHHTGDHLPLSTKFLLREEFEAVGYSGLPITTQPEHLRLMRLAIERHRNP